MNHRISLIYVYGTGEREDGIRFAVSAVYADNCPASTLALFVTADDAGAFAKSKSEALGIPFSILPSAAAVRNVKETANNRNVWGTPKELIDSDEFCPECERAVPSHYANCPLYRK